MANNTNSVTLTVNGLNYGGWKSISISAGLERLARDFTLAITWKWPGNTVQRPPEAGQKCQVYIGNDLVLTGYIFATPISYDGNSITLAVQGRSLTADLVDCAAITQDGKQGQWRQQELRQIVRELCNPYGITVIDETELAERKKQAIQVAQLATGTASPQQQKKKQDTLADHTIEPGETVFESINRLLSIYRQFATDDGHGRLIIAKVASGGYASTELVLGKNILNASTELDFSETYSEYRVLGQTSKTTNINGKAEDPRAPRKRVLIIQQNGQIDNKKAEDRANWEASHRMGKALETNYTVNGWRQGTGQLWLPNTIVRVRDELIDFDRDMLIMEVTYSLDEGGMLTHLRVAPPEAALPKPNKPKKRAKVKGTDGFEYLIPADYQPPKDE